MKKINWYVPKINNYNNNYLNELIKTNFISEGKMTSRCEKALSKFLGAKNVIMTSSGTSAIYLALRSLGIKANDEVIVPNITYVATLNAVKLTGAKPKIVEVNTLTSTVELDDLKKKINKKTKAIIFVHISGRSGNFKNVLSFAKQKKIKVIEDAAEALGSKFDSKRKLGTVGDIGCFSFTPTKIITSAQGGAVVTRSRAIAKIIRSIKDQGRTKKKIGGDDTHDLFGGNFKYNDILASILLPQIYSLEKLILKAKKNNNFYRENLKNIKEIKFYKKFENEVCIWTEIICKRRDHLFNFLLKKNIKCRKIWRPLSSFKHVQSNYKMRKSYFISNKVLWLPSSLDLTSKELKRICSQIKKFYQSTI